ncbi:MAG: Na(+)/H(+) antiporter subunit G [Firmicutes bacterium]|nr:Na(+)/H(+) antiporter subunit G [candidate division NPL-UPA2 bacterium]
MIATVIGIAFLLGGLFFFTAGTVGLLRFPDALTRMHATTKCDTLGAGMVLVGIMFFEGGSMYLVLKVILLIVFLWVTTPAAAHYIARAVYRTQGRDKHAGGN